jgi:hypothetical protein
MKTVTSIGVALVILLSGGDEEEACLLLFKNFKRKARWIVF